MTMSDGVKAEAARKPAIDPEMQKFREIVTRILFELADSQLAGSAGYANLINIGPTLGDRVDLAMIVAEKGKIASDAYAVLQTFGLNTEQYFANNCWEGKIGRNTELGFKRASSDKRLNALLYPLYDWIDVGVFTYLMASMACMQLEEFSQSNFAPLAELAAASLPVERRHADFGARQMEKLASNAAQKEETQLRLNYWHKRVATSFGPSGSQRNELMRQHGLKRKKNEELAQEWQDKASALCSKLGFSLATLPGGQ